jgi:maltose O-acetyltransferase
MIQSILAFIATTLENARWEQTYNGYRKKYSIDPTFKFNGEGICLYGEGQIILGANSYIGRYSQIQAPEGLIVKIGNNCSISHFVLIYTQNLKSSQNFSQSHIQNKGNVTIGDYCWIGAQTLSKKA